MSIAEYLMMLQIPLSHNNFLAIISTYMPTLLAPDKTKSQLYSQQSDTVRNIPNNDKIQLLGDFSACTRDNYTTWNRVMGKWGGSLNINGKLS